MKRLVRFFENRLVSWILTLAIVAFAYNQFTELYFDYKSNRIYHAPLTDFIEIENVEIENYEIGSLVQFGVTTRKVTQSMDANVIHEPGCYRDNGAFIDLPKRFQYVDANVPIEKKINGDGTENTTANWTLEISPELDSLLSEYSDCGWIITYDFIMPDGSTRRYPESFFASYEIVREAQAANRTIEIKETVEAPTSEELPPTDI